MNQINRTHSFIFGLTLLAATASLAGPLAYVPNEKSGTISVIDTATDRVTEEIKAGDRPRGLVLSRDGKFIYVSNQPRSLNIIDLATRASAGTIDIGQSPEGVGISPDGKWVVIAVEEGNSVAFIDTAGNKLSANVKVQGKNPEHAIFSPDGQWLYVSSEEGSGIDIIDARSRKQVASLSLGARPRGIAFLPDG